MCENDDGSLVNDEAMEMEPNPHDIPTAQKAAGQFLLTFKERNKLSQSAIDIAVKSINQMVTCL